MKRQALGRLFCLLGLLAAVRPQTTPNTIEMDKDMQLKLSAQPLAGNNALHTVLTPIFGRNQAQMNTGYPVAVILDLTVNSILVADASAAQTGAYGINCQAANACFTAGATAVTCAYEGVAPISCEDPCKTLLRFNEVLVSGQSQSSYPLLPFSLYTSTPAYEAAFGKNGVLGLAPNSGFWSYLNNGFSKQQGQDYVDVSTSYSVTDASTVLSSASPQELLSNSYLTVNGRVGINDPIVRGFSNAYNNSWVFEETTTVFSRSDVRNNASLCVDNTRRAYFLAPDAGTIRGNILAKLCGNKAGCTRFNSNLQALDNIKVTLTSGEGKSIDINIKPSEYVNFDSGDNAVIGIEDLSNSRCAYAYVPSPASTSLGVGLLFLTKAEFIVRITGTNSTSLQPTFQVGFNETTYPNDTIFLTILIALGGVILAIIVGIVLANSFKKREAEKTAGEEYRREEDN